MRINLMQTHATASQPTVRRTGPEGAAYRRRKARRGRSAGALITALAVRERLRPPSSPARTARGGRLPHPRTRGPAG
jgi:hypothetical protein